MFELSVINRKRRWEWRVCDNEGVILVRGWERSRVAARYRGYSALFLLLGATCHLGKKRRLSGDNAG
jgi:hypothetical protein